MVKLCLKQKHHNHIFAHNALFVSFVMVCDVCDVCDVFFIVHSFSLGDPLSELCVESSKSRVNRVYENGKDTSGK
jgi:hypothetical protein